MKKIILILLLAFALSDQCFSQTVTDGLTVTGGPAVVGADPGGAELFRVGGGVQINRYYSYSFAPMVNGGVTYLGGLSGDDLGFGAANLWHNHHVTLAAASTARTFDAPARLQVWPTSVTIGSDPGGSELLRVGGGAKFGNMIISASATQPGLMATCSSPSGFSTLILGNTGASGRQFTIGLGGNTSGQNGLLYFYDNSAVATRGYIKPDGVFIWGSDPNPGGSELLRVGGASIFSGSTTANRFSNGGFLGTNESNARNHFIQSTAGSTTPLTGGWISGAFGDTSGSRVVVGQGEGVAIIAGHTSNLDAWADLYISGSPLNQGDGVTYIRGRSPTTVPVNTVAIGGGRVMVGGTLSAKEIKVTTTGADYVFENDYKLRPLAEVEQFIAEHKHLPEMMSAKAMQADGMPVSEVVTKQLAKIEELTLYAIAQKKETEAARAEAVATRAEAVGARAELNDLKNRMERLEKSLANR